MKVIVDRNGQVEERAAAECVRALEAIGRDFLIDRTKHRGAVSVEHFDAHAVAEA